MRKLFIFFLLFMLIISCAKKEIVDVDTYDLLRYMDRLVIFVNHSISSRKDFEKMDLIYVLFHRTEILGEVTHDMNLSEAERSVKVSSVVDCLRGSFGLNENYLDVYKGNNEVFHTPFEYYDAESDMFHYSENYSSSFESSLWRVEPCYRISRSDTAITIDDNKITVKTVLLPWKDNDIISADYMFTANTINSKIYYRLEEVKIYEDTRYMGSNHILLIEGEEINAPIFTVHYNGGTQYYSIQEQYYSNNAYSFVYDPPFVTALIKIDDSQFMYKSIVMINEIAYISINCYGVCDTYVYDPKNRKGYWMSGANSLLDSYKDEIIYLQSKEKETPWGYYYYLNLIVTVSQDNNHALIRRSKKAGDLEGAYYMHNFLTGEESYVCDSYTRKNFSTSMSEFYWWEDERNLRIRAVTDSGADNIYNATFNGYDWVISELITNTAVSVK